MSDIVGQTLTDIVERLKKEVRRGYRGKVCIVATSDVEIVIAEIERLRADLNEAAATHDLIVHENEQLRELNEALRAENEKWRKYQTAAQYKNDQQHGEIERLQELPIMSASVDELQKRVRAYFDSEQTEPTGRLISDLWIKVIELDRDRAVAPRAGCR